MYELKYDKLFLKNFSKIKDKKQKESIIKQVDKIIKNPHIGKPMKYSRKGIREMYIKPYRLVYTFIILENVVIFIDIYHKDEL
ncbi:MAG: type II toxin-antitoxin system RelE family toxin [Candidatus Woesearchaeota archaeon]